MFNPLTICIGKAVQALASLRGGGSALPGRVVEKLDPTFAKKVLDQLPYGVVLVSGTNGKTTTVKVVSELLEAAGLRVFTNNTGSNFMRGVISSLLRKVSLGGTLNADIAVLELDEAHAVNFVAQIKPRYALLLNVMRDQLDRFGEIDYTAQLLSTVARNTTHLVVLNAEDLRLAAIPQQEQLQAQVQWFGLAPALKSEFPNDDSLYDEELGFGQQGEQNTEHTTGSAPLYPGGEPQTALLTGYEEGVAQFSLDGATCEATLALKGIYNAFNATAALAMVHAIVPHAPLDTLCTALSSVQSAFGRGEVFDLDGSLAEMILVKNPAGFRLALKSFDANGWATMIAVNDDYGDGRDISWFFDVPFDSLAQEGVSVVTGPRAYDMALRLAYNEVPVDTINTEVSAGLDAFIAANQGKPKRLYCSYTMMMQLRALLASKTNVEKVQ